MKKMRLVAALALLAAPAAQAHDHASCPMMSSHREGVDRRHDAVTGVSHEGAVHHFLLTPDGGSIRLEVTDPKDRESRDLIRQHLQVVARAFAEGDFALPMQIHDAVPPGADVMKAMKSSIRYEYSPTDRGGLISISTKDAAALSAIHAFLRFQIEDHGTDDPTE